MDTRNLSNEQLINLLGQKEDEIFALEKDLEKCRKKAQALESYLVERNKELRCHLEFSALLSDSSLAPEEVVIRGLNLIPEACQFPEYTGARLTVDDSEIIAGNFDEKGFLQSFPLVSFGKPHGVMTISVRKHDIASPGEAFLPEELELFGAIAIRLGKYKELSELNISKKKGEQLYHSILAASPDLITITDLTGRVTYTSDRVRQMFGVPDQESVIGKTLFEYIDPACRP